MNNSPAAELLRESFRHNAWATRRLLQACRDLTAEELTATPPGTYGQILEVLNHIVYADARYLRRLKAAHPEWTSSQEAVEDLGQLDARVEETGKLWESYLGDPLPAEEPLELDAGAYEARSSVVVVQALHHGNAHREQVCAILTALGHQPPDLQAWTWGEETGRAREVPAAERKS